MKTYRVTIIAKIMETYEVEADSLEDAEEFWCEGKLVATDDNIENEIMEVVPV